MTLFIGLGNPGSQYEETRHNIGFKVIDKLVDDLGARDVSKNSFYGKLFKTSNILFLKPMTYMNLSGKSVLAVKQCQMDGGVLEVLASTTTVGGLYFSGFPKLIFSCNKK